LLSRVVGDAELLPAARAVAADIAHNAAPVSVAITKRLLWHHLSAKSMEDAEELETRLFGWAVSQPDAREGISAFLEKRTPNWTMHPSTDLPDFLPHGRK